MTLKFWTTTTTTKANHNHHNHRKEITIEQYDSSAKVQCKCGYKWIITQ